MANKSVLVRIPATVGNFAGAIDCAALALDASLNVKVTPRLDGRVGIRYFGANGERVPRDRSNLVIRAMEAALHLRELEFTGADLEIYSSVPVAVGLGSSTAAVLAGLIAADELFRLELDEKTLFDLAAIYESRADNLRAAWEGGFVACAEAESSPGYRRTVVPENFLLRVVVPETQLAAGGRQPQKLQNGSGKDHHQRAAVLADFFARAGKGRSPDLSEPLPPTCQKVLPGMEEALQVRVPGLLNVFVCGSGPAVGILTEDNAAAAVHAVAEVFAGHGMGTLAPEFRPTNAGARDWNAVHPQIAAAPVRALGSSLAPSNSPGPRKSTLIPV
jgi:homoserine kinase